MATTVQPKPLHITLAHQCEFCGDTVQVLMERSPISGRYFVEAPTFEAWSSSHGGDVPRHGCRFCRWSFDEDTHADLEAEAEKVAHEMMHGRTMRCAQCSTLIDVMPPTDEARCLDCDTLLTETES